MIDFALTADAVAPQLLGCTLTHSGVSIRPVSYTHLTLPTKA